MMGKIGRNRARLKIASFSDRSLGPVVIATTSPYAAHDPDDELQHGPWITWMCYGMLGFSVLLFAYIVRNLTLFNAGYTPLDRGLSLLLLLSEIYVTVHGVGYYLQVIQTSRIVNVARRTKLAKLDMPNVAIYIATYNEPIAIIEETIVAVSLLDYPAKQIYVNCDHQSQEQANAIAAIAQRHGVEFIHRVPNTGFKAGGINAFLLRLGQDLPEAQLFCIFDADSVPMPTFLREVVPYFETDMRLAFVQAPQHYGNSDASLVVAAAANQQATFAHYISEGKQHSEAMFFCGTNVVFRIAALRDIGGLITTSITEDFATSLKLHARGWRSQYCNSAYVCGMGPTTLQAYWTQQGRWALGNIESFLAAIPDILLRRGFTVAQRWEYLLTGTYYFVGWNVFISLIGPVAFLLLGMRPLMLSPIVYVAAYLPHVLVANWFFFLTMGKRGFRPRILFLSQCLTFSSFPIFMSAATAALLHRKRPFAVTPKGKGETLPWTAFLWQIGMVLLLIAAISAGVVRLMFVRDLSVVINILWCVYHLTLLSRIFQFNQPEQDVAARDSLLPLVA